MTAITELNQHGIKIVSGMKEKQKAGVLEKRFAIGAFCYVNALTLVVIISTHINHKCVLDLIRIRC